MLNVLSVVHSPSSAGPILEADRDVMRLGQKPAQFSWLILSSDMLRDLLPLYCLLAEICCSCRQFELALNPELMLLWCSQRPRFLPKKITGENLLFLCCFLLGCAVLLSSASLHSYSPQIAKKKPCTPSSASKVPDCYGCKVFALVQDKPRVLWEDIHSLCYTSD